MRLPFPREIPRRSQSCAKCTNLLTAGVSYMSALKLASQDEWVREDFCLPCWKTKGEGWTSWKGTVPLKEQEKKVDLEKDEKALTLLKETLQSQQAEEAFVLALYLVRKKKLVLRKEINQVQLFELLETGEMISLQKPKLSQLKVEELQQSIAQKLGKMYEPIQVNIMPRI